MFKRDKFYDYKKFCERIVQVKSKCHPPPPPVYPFLKDRQKKKLMEKEKKVEIEYTKGLLIKKYQSMYKNHNKYHPSNLVFQPHPSSLVFSTGRAEYYELCNNNNYLGKKLLQIQKSKGKYNCSNSLKHYGEMEVIKNRLHDSCRYYNKCLDLITPHTYEKRLYRLLTAKSMKNGGRGNNKKRQSTGEGGYTDRKNNNLDLNIGDDFCYNDVNINRNCWNGNMNNGGGFYEGNKTGFNRNNCRSFSNTEKNFYNRKGINRDDFNNNYGYDNGFDLGKYSDNDCMRKGNYYHGGKTGSESDGNNGNGNKKKIIIERENTDE